MTNKIRKGEVIKKINVKDAFKNFNNFYIPVDIDKIKAEKFGVDYFKMTFIPKTFILSSPEDNITNFELQRNDSYIKEDKPFFINKESGNKKSFNIKDLSQSNFTKNQFYKKVYAKNLVSSYTQLPFKENKTPFVIETTTTDVIQSVILSESIEKITETTSTDYSRSIITAIQTDQYNYRRLDNPVFYNMLIKVYALNKNNEIIDYLDVECKKLDLFLDETNNEALDLLVIKNNLLRFANDFKFNLESYQFPIRENFNNNIDIKGPRMSFSRSLLFDIYDNNREFSTFNTDISSFRVLVRNSEVDKQFRLKNFNNLEFSVLEEETPYNRQQFAFSLINSDVYKDFINSLNFYLKQNNLDFCNLEYVFNIAINGAIISVKKDVSVRKEIIFSAYNDILKHNFYEDIHSGKVISANLNKFSESINVEIEDLYELKLKINTQDYDLEEILNSSITFQFLDANRRIISDITTLYFDESLTENNSIRNYIHLRNIFVNTNEVTFYFSKPVFLNSSEDRIRSCNILFVHQGFESTIIIGPFSNTNSAIPSNRLNRNIYDNCALLLGSSTTVSLNSNITKEQFFKTLSSIQDSNTFNTFINMSRIINNPSFRQLNYFSEQDIASIEEKTNSIFSNTLVKLSKKLIINGFEVNTISNYFKLSDRIRYNAGNNIYYFDFSTQESITNFDIDSKFSSNTSIKNDYIHFITSNYSSLSSNFNIEYHIFVDYIVFKNNTMEYFGLDTSDTQTDNSKSNFVELIFSLNSNFGASSLHNLLNKFYNNQYFDRSTELFKDVFAISNIFNSCVFNYLLNAQKSLLSTETTLDDSTYYENDFNKIFDFNHSNIENLKSNILLDIENNNFVIKKIDKSKKDFYVYGNKIQEIIQQNLNQEIDIIDSFLNIEYLFDENSISTSSRIDIDNFSISRFAADEGVLITSNIKEKYFDLSVSFEENKIQFDIVDIGSYFERFSKNEYYDYISSLTSQNNFLVKDVLLRLSLVINVNNNRNIINKTFKIKMSNNLINYLENYSYYFDVNRLNINLNNRNLDIYKPNIVVKG